MGLPETRVGITKKYVVLAKTNEGPTSLEWGSPVIQKNVFFAETYRLDRGNRPIDPCILVGFHFFCYFCKCVCGG